MLQILHGVNVNWMARRHIAFLVSGVCVLISIASLIMHGGPRYGVDFTGGSLIEIQVTPPVHVDEVRSAVDRAGLAGSEIQGLARPGQFLIRVESRPGHASPSAAIDQAVRAGNPGSRVEVLRVESVGP
ncbi:MAG TPA: hypothetical protein VER38_04820, partial [Candidatus Eisenbacteria bacterium]|nr:hypothetical protein [Candidatus Eisenbacteria bacterium]